MQIICTLLSTENHTIPLEKMNSMGDLGKLGVHFHSSGTISQKKNITELTVY